MNRRSSTPESALLRACLDLLALRGVFAWRTNNTPTYDRKKGVYRAFRGKYGVSDILGILDGGRLLAVECKTGTNDLSEHQQQFLDEVNRRGGLGVCVYSIQELEDCLSRQK